jgi:hypothetical protein
VNPYFGLLLVIAIFGMISTMLKIASLFTIKHVSETLSNFAIGMLYCAVLTFLFSILIGMLDIILTFLGVK